MEKPYYRIYRPFKILNDVPECYWYIIDKRNCANRKEIVRYSNILEREVIEILEYIELSDKNMKVYSLKIYKVFLSICTEIENNLKGILYSNSYKTGKKLNMENDYFKLEKFLKLSSYKVKILYNEYEKILQPFKEWENNMDYHSIQWYKDYNDLKHNRSDNFEKDNLENLINAMCALYIILYAQFFEYSKVVDGSKCLSFFCEDREMIIQDSIGLIDIEEKPIWNDEEKYDFDWNIIKNIDEPYNNIFLKDIEF